MVLDTEVGGLIVAVAMGALGLWWRVETAMTNARVALEQKVSDLGETIAAKAQLASEKADNLERKLLAEYARHDHIEKIDAKMERMAEDMRVIREELIVSRHRRTPTTQTRSRTK